MGHRVGVQGFSGLIVAGLESLTRAWQKDVASLLWMKYMIVVHGGGFKKS